jgi:DNA replication licensing factor MCM4
LDTRAFEDALRALLEQNAISVSGEGRRRVIRVLSSVDS